MENQYDVSAITQHRATYDAYTRPSGVEATMKGGSELLKLAKNVIDGNSVLGEEVLSNSVVLEIVIAKERTSQTDF